MAKTRMRGPSPVSPQIGPRQSFEKQPLDWNYLAGSYDKTGSVYEKSVKSGGLEARLRFSSYDRAFLEEVKKLLGGGSITGESRMNGTYYRLTLTGYYRVDRTLQRLMPHLRRKHDMVKRWLLLHRAKAEIGRLTRKQRLKPRKFLKTEVRTLLTAVRQLKPPPSGVTD